MTYWTDGSFAGLLTAVFEAFRLREEPDVRERTHGVQLTLGCGERVIETCPDKADRVWKGIERRMSAHALQLFYSAWLGESPEVPSLVLHAVRAGMRGGEPVLGRFQDPRIRRLNELYRKVTHEVHFFTGTLRFIQSPEGILHATYEPDGNITELLAPHFAERLNGEAFLIQDAGRGCCAVYDGQELTLAQAHASLVAPEPDAQADYEGLWKRYFDAIAVEGRRNPGLQRQFLPKRHWRHLTEMQGRS